MPKDTCSAIAHQLAKSNMGPYSAPAALARKEESALLEKLMRTFLMRHKKTVDPKLEDAVKTLLDRYQRAKEAACAARTELLGSDVPVGVMERFDEKSNHPRDVVVLYNEDVKELCSILLYLDPGLPHALLHTNFARQLISQLPMKLGEYLADRIEGISDARTRLSLNGREIGKEADAGFLHVELLPKAGASNNAGTIMFEGSVFNESIPELRDEIFAWVSNPVVRVAFGIKVQVRGHIEQKRAPRLYFFAAERTGNDVSFHAPISFGSGSACTEAGLEDFAPSIPASLLYEGTSDAGKPELAGVKITFDLYKIRLLMYKQFGDVEDSTPEGRDDTEKADREATKVVAEWAAQKGIDFVDHKMPSGPARSAKRRRLQNYLVTVGFL